MRKGRYEKEDIGGKGEERKRKRGEWKGRRGKVMMKGKRGRGKE